MLGTLRAGMCPPSDLRADIEDARAQFVIAIGDLCAAAEVGSLVVELLTEAGERSAGVPAWVERPGEPESIDEPPYAQLFMVSDRLVDLDDVVACTIRVPQGQ